METILNQHRVLARGITRKDLEKEQGNKSIFRRSACFFDHHTNDVHTFEAHNNLDDPLQSQHSEKLQHRK